MFAHIVAVHLIKRGVIAEGQKGGSVFHCGVEAIGYHLHCSLFAWLGLELVLPWTWNPAVALVLPALSMGEVAHFGGAAFLQRVEFVGSTLYLQKALLAYLFLVLVAQSLNSFSLRLVLPEYLFPVLLQPLLVLLLILLCDLVVPWPGHSLVVLSRLVLSRAETILAVVEGFAGEFVRVVVAWPWVAVL